MYHINARLEQLVLIKTKQKMQSFLHACEELPQLMKLRKALRD